MGDFFHHVFIGTVCKVHNQSSVCIQPRAPAVPPKNRIAGAVSQGQAAAKAAVRTHPWLTVPSCSERYAATGDIPPRAMGFGGICPEALTKLENKSEITR